MNPNLNGDDEMSISAEEAFEAVDVEFTVESGDDGIGEYEYWGFRGVDSQPYVSVACGGTVTLTWTETETETEEDARKGVDSFTGYRENTGVDDLACEITVTPVEGTVTVVAAEGGGFTVTATFEYEGEASREPDSRGPEPDDCGYDDGPDYSDADYDRMADAYFSRD